MSEAKPTQAPHGFLKRFLAFEATGGIILMAVAILALVVANSPLSPAYFGALESYVGGMSVLHWINDGLMALFFLLVGLEIKREVIEGQLATWDRRGLPGFAALGGMVVPACVFLIFNLQEGGAPKGWAIPAATDIAFALGVLSLLGSRVPASLKIFLTALAIIDDLGAVLIIALFYTADLNIPALAGAAMIVTALALLNRSGVRSLAPYTILGCVLWVFVLKSGLHATLAGVVLALTVPLRGKGQAAQDHSPLITLEHRLHPWVTFLVIPVFGFANAGISFAGMRVEDVGSPIPLGVGLGLFLGKQIGVFLFSLVAIKLGISRLPNGSTRTQLFGVAVLCGIGFTMSLFIGLLAYDQPSLQNEAKLGVILGSLASGIVGAIILFVSGYKNTRKKSALPAEGL